MDESELESALKFLAAEGQKCDRMDALKELLAKVEAGEWPGGIDGIARQVFPYRSASVDDMGLTASEAFHGDLNAALALHEALLPKEGWGVELITLHPSLIPGGSGFQYRAVVGWGVVVKGYADTPARAWLIAILRALIAEGK
jgi:hypothetical protein